MHLAKWFLSIAMVCLFAIATTSCNTVEGIGEDMQAGGEGLSNVARSGKYSMDNEE